MRRKGINTNKDIYVNRVSTPPSTTKAKEIRKVLNKQVTYVSYDDRLGSDNN